MDDKYEEKVLSQNEIDEMLSSSAASQSAHMATATDSEPESPPPPASTKQEESNPPPLKHVATSAPPKGAGSSSHSKVSSEEMETLKSTIAETTQRLSKIEDALERIGQLEAKLAKQVDILSKQSPQNQEAVADQIQELNEQMDEISDNLRSSLGYGAGKIFHCSYCDTTGKVAIHVKCTECGEENWMGWWPDKK